MTTEALTLFADEDLPEWVVEVNEILLHSAAKDPEAMEWWARYSGRPGIAARTIYLAIVPVGALLYLRCDDEDESRWLHDLLREKGLHPRGLTVRRLGRLVRCRGCGERRPFWATSKRGGSHCRPCWRTKVNIGTEVRDDA